MYHATYIHNVMQEVLPPSKQTPTHFDEHFRSIGLDVLIKFRQAQENASFKKKLRQEIDEMLGQDASNEDVVDKCQLHLSTTTLTDVDITVMVRPSLHVYTFVFVDGRLSMFFNIAVALCYELSRVE